MSYARQLNARIQQEASFVQELVAETSRVLVGQDKLINRLLIALLCNGHILIEGVPGVAKTLAVRTLSTAIQTQFKRIQFTPDLLPADLIGTQIYNPATGDFSPRLGPIFGNIILADEINRAPAKVQSALLEAMEERQVTIGEQSYKLPDVFMVLATQNPIEQEGTYPLPEAQLDRFMLKVVVEYPTREEELVIMDRMVRSETPKAHPIIAPQTVMRARQVIDEIYIDEKVKYYVLDIVFATREPRKFKLDDLAPYIKLGASPRGTISLLKAAKAYAFLQERGYVIPADIKAVAPDVLRHRIGVSFEAEAEEVTSTQIVTEVLNRIPVP
jgi:MoxR-like ATPase